MLRLPWQTFRESSLLRPMDSQLPSELQSDSTSDVYSWSTVLEA